MPVPDIAAGGASKLSPTTDQQTVQAIFHQPGSITCEACGPRTQFPQVLRQDLESWAGCIAGALEEETYRSLLTAAGFTAIEVEVTRRYNLQDISENGASASLATLSEDEREAVDGKFVSAFIRARKPAEA